MNRLSMDAVAPEIKETILKDKKTIAIILGVGVGIAAVATAVEIYVNKHSEPVVKDVNEVFEQARRTVRKLDDAVDTLRKSVA